MSAVWREGQDLNLDGIAARLASLEETLIYKLLDRAQFCLNSGAYEPGRSQFLPVENVSLFELRLLYQEKMDVLFGRYLIPEERPYHTGLPEARRRPPFVDQSLRIVDLDTVNVSGRILSAYRDFLPDLCLEGDDGHWGSSVEHDVICLQALGRRIHFGALYVAESKYRENRRLYAELVKNEDETGLESVLTRPEVEKKVLERVKLKVESIQTISDPNLRILVLPDRVVAFFEKVIIPLTKEGEIRYLLQRRPD